METREKQQRRAFKTEFETREAEDGKKYISGYFVVFDQETELWPGAYESIDPGALDGTMSGDIRALVNHDSTLVLGRTKPGTLKLSADAHGLWGDILINEKDSDAMNAYERVKRGDVDQCSFGFNILEEDTEWREDGTVKWTLKKVDLHEVSVCTFPAYDGTGIQARHNEVTQHKEKELQQWRHAAMEKIRGGK